MTGNNFYAIFWIPPTLQNGNSTSLTAKYQSVAKQFLADYPFHGISNNSTQYYSQPGATPCAGTKTYWKGPGGLSASYVDKNPYPSSGCSDSVTPGNCITDSQLRAEIQAVMTLKGWTGGFNKIFIVFTSTGEGSCSDGTSSSCAYTQYCAYHGNFGSNHQQSCHLLQHAVRRSNVLVFFELRSAFSQRGPRLGCQRECHKP